MNFNQKFEPPSNRIIHGAGQSITTFQDYWNSIGSTKPAIFMAYAKVHEINQAWFKKTKDRLSKFPPLALQLGLELLKEKKDLCSAVSKREYDEQLNELAEFLRNLNTPVFLRIGYEFNQPNKYHAIDFILAWKHIVSLFSKKRVNNVAWVWCACPAFNGQDAKELPKIMSYYPGDEYVDWWGIDLFSSRHFKNNNDDLTEAFVIESIKHQKPMMVAECSAARVGVENGQNSWNDWFAPFFDWLKSHPTVKAFCYINWNWGIDWTQPEWLNCRVYENEIVLKNFKNELKDKRYIHNSEINILTKH